MATSPIADNGSSRHHNAGRKQTPGHIAKRVAAIARARASWDDIKRAAVSENLRRAQLQRTESAQQLRRLRRAESITRITRKPTVIYALIDPRDGDIRYVGKTSVGLLNRYNRHRINSRKKVSHLYNWWRLLAGSGVEPAILELQSLPVGSDWVEAEKYWIAHCRSNGARLVNSCEGGQGTDGYRFSAESREKMRRAHLGKKIPPDVVEKRSASLKLVWAARADRKQPPDAVAKAVAGRRANWLAGLRKKRVPATEETKAKIRATKAAKKLAAAQIGTVMPSEELRAVPPVV